MAVEHIITDADTPYGLALKYGLDWDTIATHNGIEYPYFISSEESLYSLYAQGYVQVTRGLFSSALTVYRGSTFTTEVDSQGIIKTYQVTEDTVIPAGAAVGYLHVRSLYYGTFGNTIASSINTIGKVQTSLGEYAGFTDVRNIEPIGNGTDARVLTTGQTLYIPTDDYLPDPTMVSSSLDSEALRKLGGEDFALAPDGDMVEEDGFGDIATYVGVSNIEQSVRNRLMTRRGSIPKQPLYGSELHLLIGKAYLPYINKLVELDVISTLSYDDRLGDITFNYIEVSGTSVIVDIDVVIAGTSEAINVRDVFGGAQNTEGSE